MNLHVRNLLALAALAVPAHAQWSTDTLQQARGGLGATSVGTLSLFAGGGSATTVFDIVEIYDHSSESWLTPAHLSVPRRYAAAASAGGRAFFAGGDDILGTITDVVDVYDAGTGSWSVEHLSEPRTILGAAVHDGKIYFAGGLKQLAPTLEFSDVVDVYDTATGTWSVLHLSVPRGYLAVEPAGDKLLFAGGTNFIVPYDVVDVYDTAAGAWLPPVQLSVARGFDGCSASAGDLAVFAGGTIGPGVQSDAVDLYDAATGTWSTATLSAPRDAIGACALGNRLMFAGGTDEVSDFGTVDLYDLGTGLWSTAALSEPRWALSATTAAGRALFAGGVTADLNGSAAVDLFEPLGTSYCTANANSTGFPAVIVAGGSVSLAVGELTLTAAPVPDEPFVYFYGPTQGQLPFGDGYRCVVGRVTRIVPPGLASGNVAQRVVDLDAAGITAPGALNFQCWHRDPAAGGAGFNTSDAVEIVFTL